MKTWSRLAVPLCAVWLLGWIALSWAGIQDDALIHLRYADYLHRLHFITYDGVHPSYGTSSLFYVGLLALLRTGTESPLLSRAVSTIFHGALFAGFALASVRAGRGAAMRVRMLLAAMLLLLAVPSAVRWLDDGMETGMVLCLVSGVAWWVHRLSLGARIGAGEWVVSGLLGFQLVLLRNELAIVACFAAAILCLARAGDLRAGWMGRAARGLPAALPFVLGAVLAALAIRGVMHAFLPDTALAKSHGAGQFLPALRAAAKVLGGSLLFGMGSLTLWLVSAMVLLREPGARRLPGIAANALFPFVLLASAARGQEIQGVRYLVWTFFFAIVWNLLELWRLDVGDVAPDRGARPFAVVAGLCLLLLPVEAGLMYRVLTTRARTMRQFMSQPALAAAMPGEMGIATDIGYISYYTGDRICDLAGLVNGRAAAALSQPQRVSRCVAEHPGFLFVTTGQAGSVTAALDVSRWVVCGQYDFGNMSFPDRHYLIVRPDLAPAACGATGFSPRPAAYALIERGYGTR